MPDNVNITVNETIENVVINPSISTDVIDVNTYSTTENVNIAVTPELTTININSITSVSPVSSVNGQIGDVVIPTSDNNFTTVLKNKLDGIQAGAEVNVNADWNSVSGDAQILNKPSIPSISGLATVTYVDQQDALKVDKVVGKGLSTNDYTTLEQTKLSGIASGAEVNVNADWNSASGDSQILNKPTIPAAQVNSDWNATSGVAQILNKPAVPTAVTQTSQLTNNGADGVNPFITALDIPINAQAGSLVREVKNMTGATLTKGTVVYISGANGNKALVSKALAINDELSSRTFGLLQSNILNNGLGNCVIIGDLSGLDTSAFTEGAQLYLSGVTAGTYTDVKTLAPTHLVYVGKVTRSHPNQGQIEVTIQNGYELSEIHDVSITSVANNDVIQYDSATSLWKNRTLSGAGIQPTITNPITGTGTTNYLPKFTGASTLGDSAAQDNGTSIIIEKAISNNSAAPLMTRNLTAYSAPNYNQFSQIWLNSAGGVMAYIRNDGTFLTSNAVKTNYFQAAIAGSATAPVLTVANGVGLFFPSSTTVAFTTASTERMRLDAVGNLGIGTSSPNASSILDLTSTTKGFLPPRMTTVQKNAIAPVDGLVVYDTTLSTLFQYNNSNWIALTSGNHTFIKPTSGNSTTVNINGTASTTAATSLNRIHLLPYVPAQTITSNFLNINVTTGVATAVARILIYSDLNGVPNTKLFESATLDCSTTSQKSVTTAFTFKAGTTYWIGTHSGVASCTVAAFFVASLMPIGLIGAGTNASSITDSTYVFGSAPATFGSTYAMAALTTPFVTITL